LKQSSRGARLRLAARLLLDRRSDSTKAGSEITEIDLVMEPAHLAEFDIVDSA
jgi:hypothetical protein